MSKEAEGRIANEDERRREQTSQLQEREACLHLHTGARRVCGSNY